MKINTNVPANGTAVGGRRKRRGTRRVRHTRRNKKEGGERRERRERREKREGGKRRTKKNRGTKRRRTN